MMRGRTLPGTAERAAWEYGRQIREHIVNQDLIGTYAVEVRAEGDLWAVILWGPDGEP